ncbi:MAG: mechanosensitive ion channel family protein [Acidimicrobiia bacterium]
MIDPLLALVVASGANDPGLVEACGTKSEQSWSCSTVYRITGSSTAADVADALAKPIRIAVILLVAWILVRVSRRLVTRFVRRTSGSVDKLGDRLSARVSLVDTGPVPQARRAQRAETIGAVLRSIVAILIWSVAVLTVLSELGVNLAPLLAGAGIVGIALGFGAQTLVRDFLTGLFMLIEDQYGVGDVIDLGLATGTVEGVSLRTTRLRDLDGVVWHVPNGEVHRVGNKSQQWSRAIVDVAIAYDADLVRATEVIRAVAVDSTLDTELGDVLLDAPEVLGVESLGPERVVLRVVARTRPQEQGRVARELRARIKAALDDAGIAAPPT